MNGMMTRGGREIGEGLIEPLRSWAGHAPFDAQLHPGDIGWHLRHPDDQLAENGGAFLVWRRDGVPVAAGLAEANVLRIAVDPALDRDPVLGEAIAEVAEGFDYVDPLARSAARRLLLGRGWSAERDPWVLLLKELGPQDADREDPGTRRVAAPDDAAARLEVQRSAFSPGSTFSVDRWERMAACPAYDPRFDLVTWAPDGTPAAAATGWFAGPGRCAILEPVGTHADHRRKGFGRRVNLAVMAALAKAGAGAVRVHTPAANTAAVAAYEACGLRRVDLTTDLVPPGS